MIFAIDLIKSNCKREILKIKKIKINYLFYGNCRYLINMINLKSSTTRILQPLDSVVISHDS
ncbi:hypothetical protein DDB_G0268290 [Dictyostelium discoideum AX4]|uniref:Putative uncharacterized protein DDB_G0268290 n=1 Tax=Dictyostelium discoideum TaxID=44689 RepID=Y2087_DICDI|nr:hypothetical protein DDB_G0268290 [Dictyostelium discoideum AX4]Q55GM9.1 RecName: Full=Putative uncharacterized protein DDB_G0268290 [Dictyostelium discoideum]EAL73598.1 hypothetical protein DDB_G0268290 [Dictyostelium discoideum AX4]|eukprot:XP_647155.1 hypothetical protein DDB_G0268290 [Dictyostelium discoideum AX4]